MATPWAFMETSIAPLAAPNASSVIGSSHGSGGSRSSATTDTHRSAPIRVPFTLPMRTSTWPISGTATITPIDIVSRINPSALLVRSNRCWTNGICATHAPTAAPLTKKTPRVATRGVTGYGLSGAGGRRGTAGHPYAA